MGCTVWCATLWTSTRVRCHKVRIVTSLIVLSFAVPPMSGDQQAESPQTGQYTLEWTAAPPDSLALIQPRSILVTERCEVWVADPVGRLVYRWHCSGTDVGPIGRVGGGPGEFRSPWSLGRHQGDTVIVWDASPQMFRLSFFADDGAFVRGRILRVDPTARGRVDAVGVGPDGPLVWLNRIPRGVPGVNEARSYVWTVDPRGFLDDSLVGMRSAESIIETDAVGTSRMDAPFQRRPIVLFLPERGLLVGNTGENEVVRYDPAGRVVAHLDLKLPVQVVAEHDRAAFVDSARTGLLAELERSNLGPRYREHFKGKFERMLERVDFPGTRQRYINAAVGPSQSLWVELPGEGNEYARTWRVFDYATGRLVKILQVPHRWPVRAVAPWHDSLYAVEVSADGFVRIAKYVPVTAR